MGTAATKRTRTPRKRTKPTSGQVDRVTAQSPEKNPMQGLRKDALLKLLRRQLQGNGTRTHPEPGVRAARKAALLAKRREAKARARANGKRG